MRIKQLNVSDASTLLNLSRKTFFEAFLHLNNSGDMEVYGSEAFTLKKIEAELNNPDSEFYFALVDNNIAGYLKLNYNSAQTELHNLNALEIERIYLLAEYQGQQIGKQLIDFAIQTAKHKGLTCIWLGVWEHNHKAISFYRSNGFVQFGSHPFTLGTDTQTDILMQKAL